LPAGTAVVPAPPPPTAAPAESTGAGECSLGLPNPGNARVSVLILPTALFRSSLPFAVEAICACTRRDDRLRVQVKIFPLRGQVRVEAPGSPRVDRCLSRLMPGTFEPYDWDFDDVSDCVHCGPQRIATPNRPPDLSLHPVPWSPPQTKKPDGIMVYVLDVDRSRETAKHVSLLITALRDSK
jgi:hypothetical protein